MTWAFIRKLLGRGRVPRSVGGTRAAGRARARTTIPIVTGSQPIVPAARPSMTIRSPVAPEPAAPDVVMEQLREGLARGLRMLDSRLDPAQRASDLVPFARELRTNPVTAIRQLPLAAQRALAMLGDEASTASLALLFEKDPAITQSLLVRANSAYYNPTGKRVLSMSNAITRLGHGGVRNVLIQNSLQGLVCRPGGALDAMVEQAWSHMVRTAPLARAIAPDFGVDGEKAFALGLLHDVGKLVTFDRLTAMRARNHRDVNVDHATIVRALRLLHEPLGGIAVHRWGLGPEAARAVGAHHREPIPAQRDPMSEVLYVAERLDLAQVRHVPFDADEVWRSGGLNGSQAIARSLAEKVRPAKAS